MRGSCGCCVPSSFSLLDEWLKYVGCLFVNNLSLKLFRHKWTKVSVVMKTRWSFGFILADIICMKRWGGRGLLSVSSALCLGGCWKGVGFTRTPWLWKAVIGGNIAVLACLLWSKSSTARSHPVRSGLLPPSPRTGPSQTHTYRDKTVEKDVMYDFVSAVYCCYNLL